MGKKKGFKATAKKQKLVESKDEPKVEITNEMIWDKMVTIEKLIGGK